MSLCKWEDLPDYMQTQSVRPYYDYLDKLWIQLKCKRIFDLIGALLLLLLLCPALVLIGLWIKIDSKGPIFYRQVRITQYGKEFRIYKFRTMEQNADKNGHLITPKGDPRITRVGKRLRKYRLDEMPQLFNIIKGEMSFVGTRPEVPRYVREYTPEMYATMLLPAGVTSEASIRFKDEDALLVETEDTNEIYIQNILPIKMSFNLAGLSKFSFWGDLKILFYTLYSILLES